MARDALLHPTPDTLLEVNREKDLAVDLLAQSMRDLEAARPDLAEDDYRQLRAYFELAADNIEIFRQHILAMLSLLLYEDRARAGDAPAEELAFLQGLTAGHIEALREWAQQMSRTWGDEIWPGNPARIRKFADEVETRLLKLAATRPAKPPSE
jgi:hypothetical protein